MSTVVVSCEKAGCPAPEGGACIDGLTVEECPNVQVEPELDEEFPEDLSEEQTEPQGADTTVDGDGEGFPVHTSETTLAPADAQLLLTRSGGCVVLLAGEEETGKTTLASELYGRFVEDRGFAGWVFAGSQTLIAFEERLHDSRLASQRSVPVTRRTPYSASGFLHLRLLPASASAPVDFLLSDFPGELFRRVREGQDDPDAIDGLSRSDKIAVLVDGARLALPSEREMALTQSRRLLQRLAEHSGVESTADFAVIVTKWDEVACDPRAEAYWEQHRDQFLHEVLKEKPPTEFRIAARPAAHSPPIGLDAFLEWLGRPPSMRGATPLPGTDRHPSRWLSRI